MHLENGIYGSDFAIAQGQNLFALPALRAFLSYERIQTSSINLYIDRMQIILNSDVIATFWKIELARHLGQQTAPLSEEQRFVIDNTKSNRVFASFFFRFACIEWAEPLNTLIPIKIQSPEDCFIVFFMFIFLRQYATVKPEAIAGIIKHLIKLNCENSLPDITIITLLLPEPEFLVIFDCLIEKLYQNRALLGNAVNILKRAVNARPESILTFLSKYIETTDYFDNELVEIAKEILLKKPELCKYMVSAFNSMQKNQEKPQFPI